LFALLLIVPAGAITFAIWAVYAAAHWGGNKPATQRRGVLKWIFLGLNGERVGLCFLAAPRKESDSSNAQFPQELKAQTPALDSKMIIDVWPALTKRARRRSESAQVEIQMPHPARSSRAILFVRWTNGVPKIWKDKVPIIKSARRPRRSTYSCLTTSTMPRSRSRNARSGT